MESNGRNGRNPSILISDTDLKGLQALLEAAEREFPDGNKYLNALKGEIRRARVVPAAKMPPDVITMNSKVQLYDLKLKETEEFTLVYPRDADIALDRISVLAPIGTAILGHRVGDTVEWQVPSGLRQVRVEGVTRLSKYAEVASR